MNAFDTTATGSYRAKFSAPQGYLATPARIERIGVVIAAKNQAERVAGCIASVFAATHAAGWRQELWVVVVADACTDATAARARSAIGAFGQVLEIVARAPMTAYRVGEIALHDHFSDSSRHALMLISTDAATDVRPDWIKTKLARKHVRL